MITCNQPKAGGKGKSIEQGTLVYQSEREKKGKEEKKGSEKMEREGRKEHLR